MEANQAIMPKKRNIVMNAVILVLFFVVIYRNRAFFGAVYESIKGIDLSVMLQLAVLTLVYFLLESFVYDVICKIHYERLSFAESFKITFITAFFRLLTLGGGGMPARVYCYHKKGVETGDATGAWLIQYLLYRLVILLMGLMVIAASPELLGFLPVSMPVVLCGIGIVLLVVCLLTLAALCRGVTDFLFSKYRKSRLCASKYREKIDRMFEQIELLQTETKTVMRDGKTFFLLIVVNVVMMAAYCAIPSVVLHHQCGFSMKRGMEIMTLTKLLAGAIPTPSGFGSLELVYYSLLRPFGIHVEAAGILVLLRFFTVLLPFFIGGFLWLLWGRGDSGRAK